MKEIELTSATTVYLGSIDVTVVNGGSGSDAWLAKITGTHPVYKFDREFCEKDEHLSGSRKSGGLYLFFDGDGLYSYGRIARRTNAGDRSTPDRGFIVRMDGEVYEVDTKEAQTIARAMDERPETDVNTSFAAVKRDVCGILGIEAPTAREVLADMARFESAGSTEIEIKNSTKASGQAEPTRCCICKREGEIGNVEGELNVCYECDRPMCANPDCYGWNPETDNGAGPYLCADCFHDLEADFVETYGGIAEVIGY